MAAEMGVEKCRDCTDTPAMSHRETGGRFSGKYGILWVLHSEVSQAQID